MSRKTVLGAFDRLAAEGYIDSRVGDGTYVSDRLGGLTELDSPASPGTRPEPGTAATDLVRRASEWPPQGFRPFALGAPAVDVFPTALWRRHLANALRTGGVRLLKGTDPVGAADLREVLCEHLAARRGVRASPHQVVITSSLQETIQVAGAVLLGSGDRVWIEDPCYPAARGGFLIAGGRLYGLPVDDEGLDLAAAPAGAVAPRIIFVSPSNQFPLGVTMSLARRLELLSFAREVGALVIEDDYDSEFRFGGDPLTSLQGLDPGGNVLYVGTFSKSLFPSLRLGFAVVPDQLVEAFATYTMLMHGSRSGIAQAALATFLGEGHFATHLARSRRVYADRRDALLEEVRRRLGPRVRIGGGEQGLHLVLHLPSRVDDLSIESELRERDVESRALSRFYRRGRRGLVLGFGGFPVDDVRAAAAEVAAVLLSRGLNDRP